MRLLHTKPVCHPERPHAARGLCYECYSAGHPKAKRASCHAGRVAWARGLCKSCYDKVLRAENPAYAERQRALSDKWYLENHDYALQQARDYGKTEKVRARSRTGGRVRRLLSYGMTPSQAQEILDGQGNVCPICGGEFGARGPDLDHDHHTQQFRGFLCHRCNKGLGLLGDTAENLQKALAYLQRGPSVPGRGSVGSASPDLEHGTILDDTPPKPCP